MTKSTANRLLRIVSGFGLVWAASAIAGGSSRPGSNPFEAGSGVNLDELAKSQSLAPLNLIVSSNVAGKLGPCGCSINPKGGVDRRHNFIESSKTLTGTTLILDAGNALFPTRTLDPSLVTKQRERAKKIAQTHKALGIEVQNVGLLDLASGLDYLSALAKETGLALISTNIVRAADGKAPFADAYVKEVPGVGKVLVLGLSALSAEVVGVKSLDPVESTKAQIQKHKPKVTIVLSDLGQSEDLNLMAKVGQALVVIGGRDLNAIDIPLHAGSGVLIQPGIQGQQLGVFRMASIKGFSAWRNLTQDKALANRWNQLVSENAYVQKQESSEDKKRSLERIQESFAELSKYAQTDINNSWPYAYELYDLDERYAQKNKFTKLALEDQ